MRIEKSLRVRSDEEMHRVFPDHAMYQGGGIYCATGWRYIGWAETDATIKLQGEFDLIELEALVYWMKAHGRQRWPMTARHPMTRDDGYSSRPRREGPHPTD